MVLIVLQLIKAFDDFGIAKITEIANSIYSLGNFSPELTKSVFVAMPKKPGLENVNFTELCLMSHVTKTIPHVLIDYLRVSIRPEISSTKFGYVKDKGTSNAIFMLRMIAEKSIEKHQDLHLCFIDYTKASDKVYHDNLISMFENIEVDGKDLRLVRKLHWDQTAAIRIDGEVSAWKSIKIDKAT